MTGPARGAAAHGTGSAETGGRAGTPGAGGTEARWAGGTEARWAGARGDGARGSAGDAAAGPDGAHRADGRGVPAGPGSPAESRPEPAAAPWVRGASFHEMWRDLLPLGRSPATGGYRRYAWTAADADCRAWFRAQALSRGLVHEVDRNGNQWARLGDPAAGGAVVTGSHLDSVPDGGAFDGPLGVVSSFAALDELLLRGAAPRRPVAVVNFGDEEGARFGLACVGSRLATGRLGTAAARALCDADGVTLPQAMERAGHDPSRLGPDPERLARIDAFVELHIEQGRALDRMGRPVGVASVIWPHGRWRFDFRGEANHAGTTRIEDRRDPMLTYAATVLAAREKAESTGTLATFGKVGVEPGGVNTIASLVRGWLDSRAPDEDTLAAVVGEIERAAQARGRRDGVEIRVTRESYTPVVAFEHGLRDRLAALLGDGTGPAPVLPTGAGHDAGILSSAVPTAMLFVRNPTGVSHAPAETAAEDDCLAGVTALADVLEGLACR